MTSFINIKYRDVAIEIVLLRISCRYCFFVSKKT